MKKLLYIIILSAVFSTAAYAANPLQNYPTATTPAGDDWLYLQGATNDVRKLAPSYFLSASSAASTYQPINASNLTKLAALSGTNVLYYRDSSGNWTPVTIGSNVTFSGGVLSATGGGGGSGTVTSVDASGGTTGFGFTGAPITGSGTLTLTISNAATARTGLGVSTVGNTGAYADLTGKPTLATVATSGLFADVASKPTTAAGYGITNGATIDSWGAKTAPTGAVLGTTDTQTISGKSIDASQLTGTVNAARLPTSGVTLGTYGDSTHVAQVAIDATGRVTSASNVAIASGGSGTVTSVGLSLPPFLSVSGSPVTGASTLAVSYSGTPLPVANGGTGTTTPGIIAGTNVTVTGTWPNQTVNSTNPGGTVTSVTAGTGLTGGAITGAGTVALDLTSHNAFTGAQGFTTATLTDGATISWNADTAQVATVTLGGNRTLSNPTNMRAGFTYLVIVKQDGTGSRTLAYGAAYKWPGGTAPTLTTSAGAVDILTFVSDGTNMYGVVTADFR